MILIDIFHAYDSVALMLCGRSMIRGASYSIVKLLGHCPLSSRWIIRWQRLGAEEERNWVPYLTMLTAHQYSPSGIPQHTLSYVRLSFAFSCRQIIVEPRMSLRRLDAGFM